MRLALGLDIGISSVGWGIIDLDTSNIVDAGVRLFEEANRNANEERRGFRSSRRLKRRRVHRLERTRKLLEENGFPLGKIGEKNPYEVRRDAIYNEVSKENLAVALYQLVKHRGTTLDAPDDDKVVGSELSTKNQLSKNKQLLQNKYICEIQLERLQNKNEKMRNYENRFNTNDYVNEAKAILENQKQYHSEITEEFIERYLQLISKRRAYYEGPGSKISPTKYGQYYIKQDGTLGHMSMIDKMRGKCTYFPEELRIAKMSYSADLYNLLNDLNKIQIDGEYLNEDDKVYFVENFVKKKKKITLKQILKYKNAALDAIVTGYRVDLKKNTPQFTEFKGYNEIFSIIEKNNLPKDILNSPDLLDELAEILTTWKSYEKREEKIREVFSNYDEMTIAKIVDAFKETTKFVGYHSLSKKAIDIIISELWSTNRNQMEIFHDLGLDARRVQNCKSKNKIHFDDEAILSTVAKRAHRETIKIVNEARKKYGEFETIVVETAREKNSDEKVKMYRDFQKQSGDFEKRMAKLLGVKELSELHLTSKQHLALKLWEAQDGKCIYSGKGISLSEIINSMYLFEVDHIIPISISFDDSQSNKVLCYHSENQEKGQRTPYQYFMTGKAKRSFEEFKTEVLNLYHSKKINNKKKDYLLEMRDIKNNVELQKQFINRNLVDTQYAMRSFSMTLRSFFKENDIDTTVLSVRGAFTSSIRRRAHMNKDRDESFAHHAIDALIVAAIGKMPIFKFFNDFKILSEDRVVDKKTGELLNEKEFFEQNILQFFRSLMNYESKIKYSHKVDRKGNRSMTNQTIYGTREYHGERYYVGKFSNIYQLDKKGVEPILKKIQKNPESFLIAQHNPDLFDLIVKITKEHAHADNPFNDYFEQNGYIMKDGKVPVKNLKYLEKKLGVHLDITKKYSNSKNEVVLLRIKRARIDVYKNKEGQYKYIGVPYFWFKQKGNKQVLDMNIYKEEKQKEYKKIDDSFDFVFSLYKNDTFSYEKDGEEFFRIFRGDNDTIKNKIEVNCIDKPNRNRQMLYMNSVKNLTKYNVDVLGNQHKISKESFNKYLQM